MADIGVTDHGLGTNLLSLSGPDAGMFQIDGGVLYLAAGAGLDYETNPSLDVTVAVDDPAVGTTPDATANLAIQVTDVNEPPSVSLSNTTTTLAEDTSTASRVKVADIVVADDALGTNELSLSGADADLFEILDGVLYLKAGTVLDFDTNPSLDVTVAVDDTTVGTTPDATAALAVAVIPPPQFIVTSFATTSTGFTVQFNRDLDASELNLYDRAGLLGPADVAVVGAAVGPVPGSLVLGPGSRQVAFIKSDGVLAADTYTVTLTSGTRAFRDTGGNLLDGEPNGTPGGDYVATFTVTSPAANAVTVSVPDFARGPRQTVGIPAGASGLPVYLRGAQGIESVQFRLRYDPSLLELTDVSRGPDAPANASVVGNFSQSGLVTVSFISPSGLTGAELHLLDFTARVPDAARYGAKQVLDLTDIRLQGGEVPAVDDDGLHVVAFLGDTTGDAAEYDPLDAQRIQRVEVGLDTGFTSYPLLDPRILADVVRDRTLDGLDAVRILQESVGIDRVEVPPLPSTLPPAGVQGPDPKVFMRTTYTGSAGSVVEVPVEFERPSSEAGVNFDLVTVWLRIQYPNDVLTVSPADIQAGTLTGVGWPFVPNVLDLGGGVSEIRVAASRALGTNPDAGSLALIRFHVNPGASGSARLDLRASGTEFRNNDGNVLVLQPAPVNGPDAVDGLITISDVPAPVVTVNALTTNDTTPAITGTVSNGTLQVEVNGRMYAAGDGNLTVAGTHWTLQIPAGDALPRGTYDVRASATDTGGHVGSDSTTDELRIVKLIVTSLTPTRSGFVARFSGPLEPSVLNLYDSASGSLGPADVTLVGAGTGPVPGSIVLGNLNQELTFVGTGGLLAADTYTVTFRSAANGFREPAGDLLDGNDDGVVGDNYSKTFGINSPPAGTVTLSLPDFARGAGQSLNIPNTASGLPIRLDHAGGVMSLAVDLVYDPALLAITAATLAAGLPSDWSVVNPPDTSTPGVAKIRASGTTSLSGTNVDIVRLTAAVPNAAAYGAVQAIQLENVSLNGGAITAIGDVAAHKAVYLGDADGSGIHSSADAFLTVQAALGLASGFAAHAWTDPRIVGDADGSGVLSAADAFLIVQEGLGLSEPFVPDNPRIGITPVGGGIDPQFQVDIGIPAVAGGSVTVPVRLDIEAAATNVGAIEFDLFFDSARLTIEVPDGVSAGADTAGGWTVSARLVAPGQLRVGMVSASGQPLAPGLREIARLLFRVEASAGSAAFRRFEDARLKPALRAVDYVAALDIKPADPGAGGYTWTASDGSLQVGPVPNIWHNWANPFDVDGDDEVTSDDFLAGIAVATDRELARTRFAERVLRVASGEMQDWQLCYVELPLAELEPLLGDLASDIAAAWP